jgi:hypothetical protein
MPTVNIPEETYRRLAEKAAALNISVEELVAPVLHQIAWSEQPNGAHSPSTLRDRQQAFEELTNLIQSRAHRYPPGHRVDDDRESIYREREDAQL